MVDTRIEIEADSDEVKALVEAARAEATKSGGPLQIPVKQLPKEVIEALMKTRGEGTVILVKKITEEKEDKNDGSFTE